MNPDSISTPDDAEREAQRQLASIEKWRMGATIVGGIACAVALACAVRLVYLIG